MRNLKQEMDGRGLLRRELATVRWITAAMASSERKKTTRGLLRQSEAKQAGQEETHGCCEAVGDRNWIAEQRWW